MSPLTLKKFHPGFYLQDKSANTDPAKLAMAPGFTGAFVDIPWAALEPQQGRYDFGLLHAYLVWGMEHNHQLVFMVTDRDFTRSAATSRIVPKWVASVPFNAKAGNRGCVAKIWTKPVNGAGWRVADAALTVGTAIDQATGNSMACGFRFRFPSSSY